MLFCKRQTMVTKNQWLPGSGEKEKPVGGASGMLSPGKVLYDPAIMDACHYTFTQTNRAHNTSPDGRSGL